MALPTASRPGRRCDRSLLHPQLSQAARLEVGCPGTTVRCEGEDIGIDDTGDDTDDGNEKETKEAVVVAVPSVVDPTAQ